MLFIVSKKALTSTKMILSIDIYPRKSRPEDDSHGQTALTHGIIDDSRKNWSMYFKSKLLFSETIL